MNHLIRGIHHITAIAGNARINLDFYTRILGLRLVKKTINPDDPGTYHFYFGNDKGDPGTVISFFPWGNIFSGKNGKNQAIRIAFSVPENSFQFWIRRFEKEGIIYDKPAKRFKEKYISFKDPDGLKLELVANDFDKRIPVVVGEINESVGIRGFHNAAIVVNKSDEIQELLMKVLGFKEIDHHRYRIRFVSKASPTASFIDLIYTSGEFKDPIACGSVHHIAFRVANKGMLTVIREKLIAIGLQPTPILNQGYFDSMYFKTSNNMLFEVATDTPGFTTDEPLQDLGTELKLPIEFENRRGYLEKVLPSLL